MTASIRRAPAPTELSDRIANGPISAVQRTCVPPQSSVEKPGISITRTSSPYFSPKSIIAPSFRASSIGVTNQRTGRFSNTFRFTISSTRWRSSDVIASWCVKSKRSLSGRTAEPACFTCVAEHLPERLVEEVRGRVVRHRREAVRPGDDGTDAVADREALAAEREHLVVADARRAHELGARARLLVLDPAGVGDLAAALRVERRLVELGVEEPVLARLERGDRRQHVGLLVADELGRALAERDRTSKPPAERERSRCSSISCLNSSSSTARPRSRASSCVSSNGNP